MRGRFWAGCAAAVILVGCAGGSETPTPPLSRCLALDGPPVAELTLEAPEVSVVLSNPCEAPVRIASATFVDPEGPFRVVPDLSGTTLQPNETEALTVQLNTTEPGEVADTLVIAPDGLDAVELPVQATILPAALDTAPAEMVFASTDIGCSRLGAVTLTNPGPRPAQVGMVWVDHADLVLEDLPELPLTLAPGERFELSVRVWPTGEGLRAGSVWVQDTAGGIAASVPVSTVGQAEDWHVDSHRNLPLPDKVDLLFTIDRSSCNADTIVELTEAIGVLPQRMRDAGVELRLAAVSNDDGCVLGPDPFLTQSATPSATRSVFETMADLDVELGTDVSRSEMGFLVAQASFDCDPAFWREDAFWHIVHVSDEPEASGISWSSYVGDLHARRGDPDMVRVHGVVGPSEGCGSAAPGYGYLEAVGVSGGRELSICDPMAGHVDTLSEAVLDVENRVIDGRMVLSMDPIPPTLEVEVEGRVLADDAWLYDPTTNAVVVDEGARPEVGESLTVTYVPVRAPESCP